jgi:hypothetical protein
MGSAGILHGGRHCGHSIGSGDPIQISILGAAFLTEFMIPGSHPLSKAWLLHGHLNQINMLVIVCLNFRSILLRDGFLTVLLLGLLGILSNRNRISAVVNEAGVVEHITTRIQELTG